MKLVTELTINKPDDMHLHLRDGAVLKAVAPDSARHFGRAIIMPNLVPPVSNLVEAQAYKDRIRAALPEDCVFEPLMTLYLRQDTTKEILENAARSGIVKAVKLYPAGATTNSHAGVQDIKKIYPLLEHMARLNLPLCVHGEVTDPLVDIFDREARFIETVLSPMRQAVPDLRVIMEHITTSQGVDYARSGGSDLAATITTHHLIINRNHMLVGGIKPHYYCLPVAKREEHRLALVKAATSGEACFFLGTDSAPHTTDNKESACGCAGVYTAPNTMACLAHVFEEQDALEKLEGFTSQHGAMFYGLPVPTEKIKLVREAEPIKQEAVRSVEGGKGVTLFDPGFPIHWRVVA